MFNCGGCKGGTLTSVFYCGRYTKCVPFAPSQAYGVLPWRCSDCPQNPANLPAPAQPHT